METKNIKHEGLELEVIGEYDAPDETTGYKGGWSTYSIMVNDVDIIWMLNEKTLNQINESV